MLIREMGHRVKNAFAVMSGVVAMSARSAATPEAMAREFKPAWLRSPAPMILRAPACSI